MLEHAAMWNETAAGVEHTYHPEITEGIIEREIYVGPTLQASYAPLQKLRRAEKQGIITPEQREALDRRLGLFENTLDTFRQFHAAGVQLVAGTDAGWGLNPFGENYVTCLELAADANMPLWEVIEHATSRAAAAIGLGNQVGLIQAGMQADLLLVPEDPLQDISTLRTPTAVFQRGKLVAQNGQLVTRAESRA
jgi:imidazolonepropionase-like amidohydrolase